MNALPGFVVVIVAGKFDGRQVVAPFVRIG